MQKIRTRLVNFRVTDEEFAQLKTACDRQGARCLSDFARQIMLSGQAADPDSVARQVIALSHRVAALESSLSGVMTMLAALKLEAVEN